MYRLRFTIPAICLVIIIATALPGCKLLWWKKGPEFRSPLKMKVAVLPFEDSARMGGEDFDVKIATQVGEELIKTGRFVIVPWSVIETYMNEKNIPSPLTIHTSTLIGRSLGLNAVVIGAISEVSQIEKRTGALSFMPFYIPLLSVKNDVLTAVLVAKVIDVDNGIILGADIGTGETKTGLTEEDLELGSANVGLEKEVMTASMHEAVEGLSKNIIKALSHAQWKGFIKEVDGQRAVITSGSDVGITAGDKFVIFSSGEKIINAAGQTYIIPGPVRAELEAVEVQGATAILNVLTGEVHIGEAVHYSK